MEKLKYLHAVGGKGRPIPAMVMKDAISEEGYTRLGVLDEPIQIDSNLEYGEFLGEFYRNLPTPSLLNDFLNGLQKRHEANINPKSRMIETFLGSAGAGKTFRAELTGRLVHEKGAVLVDCGGKNLRELLFETVVDNPEAKDLFSKIDALLEKYNSGVDKTSLKATVMVLKKNLGEAFSQENGRVGVDWAIAAEKGILDNPGVHDALNFVAEANGLNKVEASALGLKTQEGPLIRAWKEGRPIILDEYNKSREGTGAALQVLFQVFTGEKSSHTVTGDGISFTFDRKDKKPGFFVTVTGNTIDDGGSTHGLEQSAYSRLSPKLIADPGKLDWEHRICQCLTGVPMSTLWRCQENVWKDMCEEAAEQGKTDPFKKLCYQIRMAGLTPEEKKAVPESQLALIDNYKVVLQAASQLADFYIAWSNAINPNMQKATDYTDEIDEEYSKMVGLNLRKMIEHVNTALQPRINGTDEDQNCWDLSVDFDKPISTARPKRVEPLEKFGTNLMMTIIESVDNTTMNNDPNQERRKTQLRKYLYTVMAETGIIPNPKKNIKRGGIRPIEELLNIHIDRPEDKYREISGLICDDLKARYPELGGRDNDSIIPPSTFETVFQNFKDNHNPDEVLMPNISSLEEFADKPFEIFKAKRIDENTDLSSVSSMTKSQLLISLTIPEGKEGFNQIFATAKAPTQKVFMGSFLGFMGTDRNKKSTESTNLTTPQNGQKAPTDVFINVVQTQDDNMLIIYNKTTKGTLILGNGKVSDDLEQALEKQNISYMQRNSSPKELNESFKRVSGVENPEILAYLLEDLGAEATSFSQFIENLSPASLTKTIRFQQKSR